MASEIDVGDGDSLRLVESDQEEDQASLDGVSIDDGLGLDDVEEASEVVSVDDSLEVDFENNTSDLGYSSNQSPDDSPELDQSDLTIDDGELEFIDSDDVVDVEDGMDPSIASAQDLFNDEQSLNDEHESLHEQKLSASIEQQQSNHETDFDENEVARLEVIGSFEDDANVEENIEKLDNQIADLNREISNLDMDDASTDTSTYPVEDNVDDGDLDPLAENLNFSAVSVDENASIRIEFENGAWILLHSHAIQGGVKFLKLGEQIIKITTEIDGYRIESSGVELFYPLSSAASSGAA